MSDPRHHTFKFLAPSGFVRVAYVEHGDPASQRVLVAAHGAIRNSRDFDALGAALAKSGWRVIALDLPGRGDSEWLPNAADYSQSLYLSVYGALIARLGVSQIDWIGSSMGGGLGLQLASRVGSPIRRLILNDSGPVRAPGAPAPQSAPEGEPETFDHLDAVEARLRIKLFSYGIKDDAWWSHFARHSVRPTPDGRLRWHHDPRVQSGPAAPSAPATDPWTLWDNLPVSVLVFRGADSRSLSREITAQLAQRGPRAQIVEFPGIGHFPSLTEPVQIELIREFLERRDTHEETGRRAAVIRSRIRELPPAAALAATPALRIDVRNPSEFSTGHLPDAVNLPLAHLATAIRERAPDLSAPLLVYCAGGNRGALAAELLQSLGYRDVVAISGGLKACPLSSQIITSQQTVTSS